MWVDPSNGELMGTTSLVGIVKYLQTQQHCLQRGPAGRAACCRRGKHTALLESEEMPSAFSSELRYLSMRSEKSR